MINLYISFENIASNIHELMYQPPELFAPWIFILVDALSFVMKYTQ